LWVNICCIKLKFSILTRQHFKRICWIRNWKFCRAFLSRANSTFETFFSWFRVQYQRGRAWGPTAACSSPTHSISPTFFCACFFVRKCSLLPKRNQRKVLSYKKRSRKTLMKLTPTRSISPTFYEHLCHTKEFCSICTISYHQLSWRFKIVVLAVGILHGRPLSIALGGKNGQPRQGDVKPLWSQFLQHFTSIFVMSLSALTACVCNFFWRKEIGAIIYL